MELMQYFSILHKWYRLILLGTLLAGFTALVVSFTMPPTYEAEAAVAVVTSGVQVSFDPKIKTVSEMDLAQRAVDQTARRKSLTTIAKSPDIANAVIAKIGDRLNNSERIPADLVGSIEATSDGDLIKIKAKANSGEKAALIANTWAQEYERRVNLVYGENPLSLSEIQSQADAAKRDYDTKETALIAYLADNPIDRLSRQVAEKQQILSSLRAGKDTAIKTIVNKELEARSQIIGQYLTAQAQDRLIAFTKEQEGKTKLLGSYLDAAIAARLAVFNQQSSARIQKLADLYTIANKLDRLLADATALRGRLTSGASSPSQGNQLAGILLEASAFSTWSNLPVTLQIPMDQLSAGATTAEQLRNLDALIVSLKDRRKTVQDDIDAQSKDLLSNSGFAFLNADAFGKDPLIDSVKQKYPELFAIGDLTKLTDAVGTDNPLAKAADEKSRALLQLEGLEKVVATSATNEPITKAIDQLQQEVNQLQAQLEQENAKKQELVRARDLAWSTYTTLANKVAEVNVAAQSKGTVVRLAVPAIAPESPAAPKKSLNTLLAALVGLMLGVGAAFLLEYLNDSVTSEDQVTKELGLATIGAIPELPMVSANGRGPVDYRARLVVKDTRSAATEAFRILRHNVVAYTAADPQVLMLASALPSEGKSTVAANLAALVARSGKPVTLVDADFRRPSQHKLFGLKNNQGLYNILNDGLDNWEAYAQPTEIENLRVVTSGPLPQDPAALLDSPIMARWVKCLKDASHVVIIDTPAVLGLADATIVARVVDGIVMVIGTGMVSRRDAVRAKERFTATGIPVLGVILNRTAMVPGALTYEYYAKRKEAPSPSTNGWNGFGALSREWLTQARDRLVDLVGPR